MVFGKRFLEGSEESDGLDLRPSKRPSQMLFSDASADENLTPKITKDMRVPTQELLPIVDVTEPNSEFHRKISNGDDRVALLYSSCNFSLFLLCLVFHESVYQLQDWVGVHLESN